MKKTAIALALGLASLTTAAVASDTSPSYDYASASYVYFDFDGGSVDGFTLDYSKSFTDNLFGEVDYLRVSEGATVQRVNLQLGYAYDLNDNVDLVATGGISHEKVSGGGFSISDTGFVATAGVRSRLSSQFEAGASIDYYNFDDSFTEFTFYGRYFFRPNLSANAAFTLDDDSDSVYKVGVSFHF